MSGIHLGPIKRFSVHEFSMEPKFRAGDRMVAYRLKHPGQIKRGDIVIFRTDILSDFKFKRVVGLPKEKLQIINGEIHINDRLFSGIKGIIKDNSNFGPILIPLNHFFLIGNNMRVSQDSRFFGAVPFEQILYKAFAIYRPLKHFDFLI